MIMYKCDRCGKLINPKLNVKYYYVEFGVGSADIHGSHNDAHDLCEECYTQFLKWYNHAEFVWATEEQLKGKVGKDGIYFTGPNCDR